MHNKLHSYWPEIAPIALAIFLALLTATSHSAFKDFGLAVVLMLAVVTSVHHAELIVHRLGEPFGTLILALALAVTVIETALILAVMLFASPPDALLARDTIYSTNDRL